MPLRACPLPVSSLSSYYRRREPRPLFDYVIDVAANGTSDGNTNGTNKTTAGPFDNTDNRPYNSTTNRQYSGYVPFFYNVAKNGPSINRGNDDIDSNHNDRLPPISYLSLSLSYFFFSIH